MSTLTKKQRIVLWLLHQGKTLRYQDRRTFFTDKAHIGINTQTIDKLMGLDFLDEQGGTENGAFVLSEAGKDFVKNHMKPFTEEVTYGGMWVAKPFRGCDYCGRTKSPGSIKKFDCVTCDAAHRACPPCRNQRIRVKGEFPRYQARLKACPPKKAEEAPSPQTSQPSVSGSS